MLLIMVQSPCRIGPKRTYPPSFSYFVILPHNRHPCQRTDALSPPYHPHKPKNRGAVPGLIRHICCPNPLHSRQPEDTQKITPLPKASMLCSDSFFPNIAPKDSCAKLLYTFSKLLLLQRPLHQPMDDLIGKKKPLGCEGHSALLHHSQSPRHQGRQPTLQGLGSGRVQPPSRL